MFFSSSLVALNTAWSGYQGFGFDGRWSCRLVAVEPVVVVDVGHRRRLRPERAPAPV